MCIVLFLNDGRLLSKDVTLMYSSIIGDKVSIDGIDYYITDIAVDNYYQFKCSIYLVELNRVDN